MQTYSYCFDFYACFRCFAECGRSVGADKMGRMGGKISCFAVNGVNLFAGTDFAGKRLPLDQQRQQTGLRRVTDCRPVTSLPLWRAARISLQGLTAVMASFSPQIVARAGKRRARDSRKMMSWRLPWEERISLQELTASVFIARPTTAQTGRRQVPY